MSSWIDPFVTVALIFIGIVIGFLVGRFTK